MSSILKGSRFLLNIFVILFFFATPKIGFSGQPQRYLITAASSGLGTAICETLAAEGHSLILAGRDEAKLKQLKSKLSSSYHGNYSIELFDYANAASLLNLGSRLKNQPINGIVIIPPRINITGIEFPSYEEWSELFKLGFIAPLEIIKQTHSCLEAQGSIVIISGLTSVHFLPNYKNSNVLRKMWIAEMKNLVYQLGDRKIRVNSLSPGITMTGFNQNKIQERANKNHKTVEEQLNEETKEIPLKKYGQPQDIAQATEFLLSGKSGHINGANLVIDGGFSKAY